MLNSAIVRLSQLMKVGTPLTITLISAPSPRGVAQTLAATKSPGDAVFTTL